MSERSGERSSERSGRRRRRHAPAESRIINPLENWQNDFATRLASLESQMHKAARHTAPLQCHSEALLETIKNDSQLLAHKHAEILPILQSRADEYTALYNGLDTITREYPDHGRYLQPSWDRLDRAASKLSTQIAFINSMPGVHRAQHALYTDPRLWSTSTVSQILRKADREYDDVNEDEY